MKRDDLALLLFVAAIWGAVAWAIVGVIAERACVPPASGAEHGCLEYWVNRYQTAWAGLLGAAAALTAAWVAWHSIQYQIVREEAAKQQIEQQARAAQAETWSRETATFAAIEDRLMKYRAALHFSGEVSEKKFLKQLERTPTPTTTGLLQVPNSTSFLLFVEWVHEADELKAAITTYFEMSSRQLGSLSFNIKDVEPPTRRWLDYMNRAREIEARAKADRAEWKHKISALKSH